MLVNASSCPCRIRFCAIIALNFSSESSKLLVRVLFLFTSAIVVRARLRWVCIHVVASVLFVEFPVDCEKSVQRDGPV
jgi:hypothetical protein